VIEFVRGETSHGKFYFATVAPIIWLNAFLRLPSDLLYQKLESGRFPGSSLGCIEPFTHRGRTPQFDVIAWRRRRFTFRPFWQARRHSWIFSASMMRCSK